MIISLHLWLERHLQLYVGVSRHGHGAVSVKALESVTWHKGLVQTKNTKNTNSKLCNLLTCVPISALTLVIVHELVNFALELAPKIRQWLTDWWHLISWPLIGQYTTGSDQWEAIVGSPLWRTGTRNVSAVSLDALAIFLILLRRAPAAIFAVWTVFLVWGTPSS